MPAPWELVPQLLHTRVDQMPVMEQDECQLGGRRPGSRTSGSVLDFGQVTVFLAQTLPPLSVRAALNLCGTQFSLALSCT